MKALYILSGAVIGLLVAAILPGAGLLKFFVGAVIGLIVGVLAASVLVAQSRGEEPENVVHEVVRQATEPDAGVRERPVHEQMARANQALRLDGNVSDAVISAFERLIDQVRLIVPEALERSPKSEMTFDLVKLGSEHLSRYVGDFLGLNATARADKEGDLLAQLSRISERVHTAANALAQGRVHDFESQHGFLQMKF